MPRKNKKQRLFSNERLEKKQTNIHETIARCVTRC